MSATRSKPLQRGGGDAIKHAREVARQSTITVETKCDKFDLTTQADKRIERYLVSAIIDCFPGHAILGEEGVAVVASEPWQSVIDPIAGTFNFATGLPGSAYSIVLLHRDEARFGVPADLASGAVFRARRGHALINSKPRWVFDPQQQNGRGHARLFLEYGGEGFDADMLAALSQLATVRPIVPRLVGSAAIALLAAALKGGCLVGFGSAAGASRQASCWRRRRV